MRKSFATSIQYSGAMAGWYPPNIAKGIDAYDVLGVEPGPAHCHPMERCMQLSTKSCETIDFCFNKTMEVVDGGSQEAEQVASAYNSLRGDARREYDRKLLAAASVTQLAEKYSICNVLLWFVYIFALEINFKQICILSVNRWNVYQMHDPWRQNVRKLQALLHRHRNHLCRHHIRHLLLTMKTGTDRMMKLQQILRRLEYINTNLEIHLSIYIYIYIYICAMPSLLKLKSIRKVS